MTKIVLIFLLLTFGTVCLAQRVSSSVTGNWAPVIDTAVLISGTGTLYSSVPIQLEVQVSGKPSAWQVVVSGAELPGWPGSLGLAVSAGGAEGFVAIGGSPTLLVEGVGNVNEAFDLVYRLSGVDFDLPAGTYVTSVTYTVTAN